MNRSQRLEYGDNLDNIPVSIAKLWNEKNPMKYKRPKGT